MKVLIAGLGEHKEYGLRSLRDAGHTVGVLEEPDRVPFDLCDWWAFVECRDVDAVTTAIERSDLAWDVVLCWEEVAVDVAHESARRLGLAHPRMPAGHFRDKGVMHGRVRAAGLTTPQIGVATSFAVARELTDGRYPVVVKPADYGGSCGVRIVCDEEALRDAFAQAAQLSYAGRVVVDRYVAGPEFSVEAVTTSPKRHDVVCVVEKRLTPPPYCAEVGHWAPATLGVTQRGALVDYAIRVLDALEISAGVTHGEFRLTPGGPTLMEVAGRPAGGFIPRLVDLVTGCNLYRAEVAAVAGLPVERRPPDAPAAAVHFFTGNGVTPAYRRIDVAAATTAPLVGVLREVRYWVPADTVLPPPRDVDDRGGLAVLAGEPDRVRAALHALDSSAWSADPPVSTTV